MLTCFEQRRYVHLYNAQLFCLFNGLNRLLQHFEILIVPARFFEPLGDTSSLGSELLDVCLRRWVIGKHLNHGLHECLLQLGVGCLKHAAHVAPVVDFAQHRASGRRVFQLVQQFGYAACPQIHEVGEDAFFPRAAFLVNRIRIGLLLFLQDQLA
jgi:hypothetical protein